MPTLKITEPTLLVNKKICLDNIDRMMEKAKKANAALRPHFKTHHSASIAQWFRSKGVEKCTVSSVSMASYFHDHGWNDITIAFPYNPLESDKISKIAANADLTILIESTESLSLAKQRIKAPVSFNIKLDVGTHRTGISPEQTAMIEEIISQATDNVRFKGFVAHAGHTYRCTSHSEIAEIYQTSMDTILPLKERFGGIISWGDTPTCSVIEDLSAVDEIRAGNFTFYDWMQVQISSCDIGDIAVCLAAPVVAKHPERDEVVIYGGGVHLSKDFVMEGDQRCFGKVVRLTKNGWDTEIIGTVDRLSQEHGIIKMAPEVLSGIKIGDLVGIIPVHSCLAADLQGHYYSTEGQKIEKIVKA